MKYKDLGSFDYRRDAARCVTWKTDRYVPGTGGDSSAQTDNFMTNAPQSRDVLEHRLLRCYRWPEVNPCNIKGKTKTATLKTKTAMASARH
ncbi:hypothetical protein ACNKHT_02025 [Shigella flexneri]